MMVRKANGYVTNTGQFFQTKAEAEAYEAVAEYASALEIILRDSGFVGTLGEYVRDVIKYFVLSHGPEVKAYIDHFQGTTPEKPTMNDIRAPATGPVADFPGDTPIPSNSELVDLEDTFDQDLADLEIIDEPPEVGDPMPTDEDFSDLTPEQRASIFGGDAVDYDALHAEAIPPEPQSVGENDPPGASSGGDG